MATFYLWGALNDLQIIIIPLGRTCVVNIMYIYVHMDGLFILSDRFDTISVKIKIRIFILKV